LRQTYEIDGSGVEVVVYMRHTQTALPRPASEPCSQEPRKRVMSGVRRVLRSAYTWLPAMS